MLLFFLSVDFSSPILVFSARTPVRKPSSSPISTIFARPDYGWRTSNLTSECMISFGQGYMLEVTHFYIFSVPLTPTRIGTFLGEPGGPQRRTGDVWSKVVSEELSLDEPSPG